MSVGYLQVLRGTLHFTAHLEASESQITKNGGTIFAVDSVGYPIALEFVVGEGRICFLPPNNIPADRMGAALIKVITAHFNKAAQIDAPGWAGEITVPGANIHDKQIVELTISPRGVPHSFEIHSDEIHSDRVRMPILLTPAGRKDTSNSSARPRLR